MRGTYSQEHDGLMLSIGDNSPSWQCICHKNNSENLFAPGSGFGDKRSAVSLARKRIYDKAGEGQGPIIVSVLELRRALRRLELKERPQAR